MSLADPPPASAPGPGWYADPADPRIVRWWSGQGWTEYIGPASNPGSRPGDDDRWTPINLLVPRASSLGTRALVWGIVSLVLPIVVIPAMLAIAFGAGGVSRGNDLRRRGFADDGRARAIVGICLGGSSLLLVVVGYAALSGII